MSGPQGDYSFFSPPNFTIRVRHTIVLRGEAEEQLSLNCRKSLSISCDHLSYVLLEFLWEMDGPNRMDRQKFPFSIENILSNYPTTNGVRRSCGASGPGLKERAGSPLGGPREAVHHTCLCCCYCSHCGDIYHTDFIQEGKREKSPFCFKLLTAMLTSAP